MNKELLEKYCNNCCTEKELISALEWFEESAGTTAGKSLLFKLWEELPDEEVNTHPNFDLLLCRIHHEINLSQSKKLLQRSNHQPFRHQRKERFIETLTKIAAILLLPVLCIGLYTSIKYKSALDNKISDNQTYSEVFSSLDAITKVSLPDGSKVWLNHNSSIKYPQMFFGNNRSVELIGEGYFDIVANPEKPFVVKADRIQIKATGTEFNIMAYPDENTVETSLINGQVEVLRTEPNGKSIHLLEMKPFELARFEKNNNEISINIIPDNRYYSWRDGKLMFSQASIEEVAKKLSRWFNVDIQIKDVELLKFTYTATFVNETLPQVMELIAIASPITYEISDRQEIGTGIFSKRKVILSYKPNYNVNKPRHSNKR